MRIMDGKHVDNPVSSPEPVAPGPMNTSSNEQDDYASASQATVDYSHFTPQLKPKKLWPRIVGWTLLVVVVIAGIGGGVYWVEHHKSQTPKASQTTQHTNSQNQAKISSATKQYNSSNFNLAFNYPTDWNVVDGGNGKLTVTSLAMQLEDANGQSVSGQVVVTIQKESSMDFSMFKDGNAVAVLTSQRVAYANPTPTQRANTYISFLQYAATTVHGALDGVYVTGDFGYQKDQAIPQGDITKIDPVITVTFKQCANTQCTGTVKPLSVQSTMWDNTNFSGPILKMIESLTIQ